MPLRTPTRTLTPVTAVRPHRRFDLALGIAVGIVLGLAIVSGFVFLGSEASIDAPRIKGVDTGKPAARENTAPEATNTASTTLKR
jgi:hypothetical protein